jgi:hypothetical protein
MWCFDFVFDFCKTCPHTTADRCNWSWRMPFSGMRRCVVLVWTDVSEECIPSIFKVEKGVSEEPAWADGCRLSCQSKTTSYIRTGKEGEWATWEISSEKRGGKESVEMGEHVAGQSRYRNLSRGNKEGLPSGHWSSSLGTKLPSMQWPV